MNADLRLNMVMLALILSYLSFSDPGVRKIASEPGPRCA
jgi:hypothetical protein